MSRVTAADVMLNFETSLSEDEIDGWIDTATVLVDDIEDVEPTTDPNRLEQIELALSRHFAHAQDPRVSSSTIGDSQKSYQGETGLRIDATHYGQQAAMLDPTDTLTGTNNMPVGIEVIDGRNIDDV